jgi:4-diphosphocytidyl-2-C-methyl-D-erythritol kinase
VSVAVRLAAPAKVNLFLRVFDERPDGYHALETLFQAIDLADDVRLERADAGVELAVVGADLGPPGGNLAHRAATALLAAARVSGGVRIELRKRIPAGAGLGGGSSDAAAVLKGVAALYEIPTGEGLLRGIAARLGSDVPFFLGRSPLAAGRDRGDVLEPFAPLEEASLVLVSPPVHVSTAWAYRALDQARRVRGPSLGPALRGRPSGWPDLAARLHNDFQAVVGKAHPEVLRSLEALERAGAVAALMSGSGSTSFGIFPDRAAAERAAETIGAALGWPCRAVRTLAAFAEPRLD